MSSFVARLVRWGVALGRWLLEELAESVPMLVLGYMRGKIKDFMRRKARARRPRRKRWLQGRIDRWTWVANEIQAHQEQIENAANDGIYWLEEKAIKRLPKVAAGEKYRRAA